jgi:choline dehydrogenase-like flavoprotein
LPAAEKTGNMTLVTDSVAANLIMDKQSRKISGVRVVDTSNGQDTVYNASVVFLCASTLNSAWLLLNSADEEFPNGLANSSGAVGKYLMDHQYRAGAVASFEGFENQYYFGGRPNGIYIPRFRNLTEKHPDFIRGYGYQGSAGRPGPDRGGSIAGIGPDFKNELSQPGPWQMRIGGFGEVLPYADNHISLNHDKLDINGLPTLNIHCKHRDNEKVMREDFKVQAAEMLEAAGGTNVTIYDEGDHPGFGIHEMGTARMGRDPNTSVLNQWNQCHDIKNLFITDGSCMTSASCVNPSITYMALTARAVDFAVSQMKKMAL